MFGQYNLKNINRKILKISDVINKQQKKIRKLEDKKMKIEIAGGTLKKVDNKQTQPIQSVAPTSTDESNPFNKLLAKQGLQSQVEESIAMPNPSYDPRQQQMMQEEQLNQLRQQMMQEEQMKQRIVEEQYRQQLIQQQMAQQQMMQ